MKKIVNCDERWMGKSIPDNHWHFHRQLLLRYRLVLRPGEFSDMIRDIQGGRALLIERRAKNTAIYSVLLLRQHERIFVLSDGRQVFTAWPPEKRLNDKRRHLMKG